MGRSAIFLYRVFVSLFLMFLFSRRSKDVFGNRAWELALRSAIRDRFRFQNDFDLVCPGIVCIVLDLHNFAHRNVYPDSIQDCGWCTLIIDGFVADFACGAIDFE